MNIKKMNFVEAYEKLARHYPIKGVCLHIGKVTSMRAG